MASSTYSVSGLASNLDTSSIVEKLVELESAPLNQLKTKQTAIKTQVSILGKIAGKLDALNTATKALASNGALAVSQSSSASGYTAAPGSSASAGRYSVQTLSLATAAKARSVAFADSSAEVKRGSLTLSVSGTDYHVDISQGSTLSDVAKAISTSGAPVTASVISDGTQSYLSITNKDTGYTIGGDPNNALKITEVSTGSSGTALGAVITSPATNAKAKIDGLTIERKNNDIADAVPGTTLTLKQVTAAPEDLVLSSDATGTAEKLKTFVTAYNDALSAIHSQLAISAGTDRETTLAGDSTLRSLQSSLQSLLTSQVTATGAVRTMADLGMKTARDGTISLDETVLSRAIAADPGAVNNLFSDATNGLGKVADSTIAKYTNSVDGLLTARTNSLNKRVRQLDDDQSRMQARIDSYRTQLVAQFTAMENTISSLKGIQQFLDQQNKDSSS